MFLMLALIAGCNRQEPTAAPPPHELTREANGYYCGMIVVDHPGPKAQIFLRGQDQPIWFTSVRDAMAYTRLPEESKAIAAIYVTDMGRAQSWNTPGPGIWIAARQAWYVLDSAKRGGMGAKEAVPFGDKAAALAFIKRHGGRITTFSQVPDNYILGGDDEMNDDNMNDKEQGVQP
jgi:copper chaperone NosL